MLKQVFEAIDVLLMDMYGDKLSENDKVELRDQGMLTVFKLYKELRRIKREELELLGEQ
jgi:hypothetical protein